MEICHFYKVERNKIKAKFSDDSKHRYYLEIPLIDRPGGETLCIIGQNPSKANEEFADKTIHYLERYVYEIMPQYSKIIILNLYSRIDPPKTEIDDLIREENKTFLNEIIKKNNNFLIIYGKLYDEEFYRFIEKAKELKLQLSGKSVYKIDITSNYAPHPGNPKIYYGNYSFKLGPYEFNDIE